MHYYFFFQNSTKKCKILTKIFYEKNVAPRLRKSKIYYKTKIFLSERFLGYCSRMGQIEYHKCHLFPNHFVGFMKFQSAVPIEYLFWNQRK